MAVDVRSGEGVKTDDADLQEQAEKMIRSESDLGEAQIEVSSVEGWITLRGAVDALWKKRLAEEAVSILAGVQGVTNELAVVPSRAYEDELIADSIVAALERDPHVDVGTVGVRVNGGNVTLSGHVPSLPAFRIAQMVAEDTPGVVTVDNELEIR
jgi:osmotically-inducible protein OsmY